MERKFFSLYIIIRNATVTKETLAQNGKRKKKVLFASSPDKKARLKQKENVFF